MLTPNIRLRPVCLMVLCLVYFIASISAYPPELADVDRGDGNGQDIAVLVDDETIRMSLDTERPSTTYRLSPTPKTVGRARVSKGPPGLGCFFSPATRQSSHSASSPFPSTSRETSSRANDATFVSQTIYSPATKAMTTTSVSSTLSAPFPNAVYLTCFVLPAMDESVLAIWLESPDFPSKLVNAKNLIPDRLEPGYALVIFSLKTMSVPPSFERTIGGVNFDGPPLLLERAAMVHSHDSLVSRVSCQVYGVARAEERQEAYGSNYQYITPRLPLTRPFEDAKGLMCYVI